MIDVRHISKEELEKAISLSFSWSEAMRRVGKTPRGSCFTYFQKRVRKLDIDTSHFLGKASHAGERHTGIAKKKHWSEILIFRTTKDRDRSPRLRRAYFEYCNDKNIPVRCVECSNNGTWRKKQLRLQVSHKDDRHYNNVPENLEWRCPNCHDIITKF